MESLMKRTAALLLAACMAVPSYLNVFAEGEAGPVSSASPSSSAEASASLDEEKEKAVTVTADGLEDDYQINVEPITDETQIDSIQSFLDDRKVIKAYELNPVKAEVKDPDKGAEITLTFSKDEAPDADDLKKAGLYHLIDYTLPAAESDDVQSTSSSAAADAADNKSDSMSSADTADSHSEETVETESTSSPDTSDSSETNTVSPSAEDVNVNASWEKLDYTYSENTRELKFTTKSFSPFVIAKMTMSELKKDGKTDVTEKPNFISRVMSLFSSSKKSAEKTDSSETAAPDDTQSPDDSASPAAADTEKNTDTTQAAKANVLSDSDYSVTLQQFTASIADGASKNSSGDYVWTADYSNAGHGFMYQVNYRTSGEGFMPANTLQITIPKRLLKDRNGNYADAYEMSLPIETAAGLTDENPLVYKEDGDNLVIYNRIEIEAAQNGNFQILYKTSKQTFEYADYGKAVSSDTFKASISVDGSTAEAQAPAVNIDTTAEITGQSIPDMPVRYKEWQDSWGTKPADADNYVYLDWVVRSYISSPTQPYTFTLGATVTKGNIVGYKYSGESTFTAAHSIYAQKNGYTYGRYDHVLTRLDKKTYGNVDPALTSYTVYLKTTGDVVPEDKVDTPTHASATGRYYYERPVFYRPTGRWWTEKYGRDYRDIGPDNGYYNGSYDSESFRVFGDKVKPFINDESSTLGTFRYHTYIDGYPGMWTVKDGDNALDPANYWKQPVKYELFDEDLYYGVGDDYAAQHTKMTTDDYNFTSLDFEYTVINAAIDDDTQKFYSTDRTPSADDKVSFYAKKASDTDYVLIGTYTPSTGVWSDVNSDYVTNAAEKHIDFADGVKMYKVSTDSAHYFTCVDVYPEITLNNTDAIKSYIETNKYRFAIRNRVHSEITRNGSHIIDFKAKENSLFDNSGAAMEGADYGTVQTTVSTINKSIESYHNDTVNKTVEEHWDVTFSEKYATTGTPVVQASGRFYDLLPEGADYKPNTVAIYADGTKLASSDYSVSVDNDWKGGGRTMLIVNIGKSANKYEMEYVSLSSWDALRDFGRHILNTAAYETGNSEIGDGYPDDGTASAGSKDHPASQKITEQTLMSDLDNDASAYGTGGNKLNKFVYAEKSADILVPMAANLGLYKKVKSDFEDGYRRSTTVKIGEGYSYKIRFASDANTTASNMIVYDALEQYTTKDGKSSDWRGTLQSVNVGSLRALGANPIVYYSTTVTDVSQETDTLDSSKWSTSAPADMSTVTAIAVDIRKKADGTDFIMNPNTAVSMYIYMKAPDADNTGSSDPTAYNNIYLYDTVKSDTSKPYTGMIHQDYTSVKLRVMGNVMLTKFKAGDHTTVVPDMTFNLSGTSAYGTEVNITQTTSSSGMLFFTDIEKGDYILQETKTNDDWLLNTNRYAVHIDGNGNGSIDGLAQENGDYAVENNPRIHGDLKLRTIDSLRQNIGLKDAEFKLEGISSYGTNVLMYATSSAGGYTTFKNVEMGTYKLTETKTPDGYILNKAASTWTAVCDENGTFSVYNGTDPLEVKSNFALIPNEPLHKFTLLKVPSVRYTEDDPTALSGAEFELTGTSDYGTTIDLKETTGSNGMLTFKDLEPGGYALKETKAPDGYHKRDDVWPVVIKADDTVTIDGLTDDGYGNWQVVDEKIPTDKVVITKHWHDGLTGDAANNRPYPNIVIASYDRNEAMNIPVNVEFKDGSDPTDVSVTLKRNGTAVAAGTISKSALKTVFNNMPKYDSTTAETNKYTLEVGSVTNYKFDITGDSSGFTVTGEDDSPKVYYAVSPYGIGKETLKEGTAGITFGPATGNMFSSYTNGSNVSNKYTPMVNAHAVNSSTYLINDSCVSDGTATADEKIGTTEAGSALQKGQATVTASQVKADMDAVQPEGEAAITDSSKNAIVGADAGTDASGNAYRCIHYDNWNTILYWNEHDPHVYDKCITNHCSKRLIIRPTFENDSNSSSSGRYWKWNAKTSVPSGDGNTYAAMSKWDIYYDSNYTDIDEYSASLIRARLVGADQYTSEDSKSAGEGAKTKLTESGSVYASLPSAIRSQIGAKALYDTSYSSKHGTNISGSSGPYYDKVWLFDYNEIFNRSNSASSSVYTERNAYNYGTRGSETWWWLRSRNYDDSAYDVYYSGRSYYISVGRYGGFSSFFETIFITLVIMHLRHFAR